MLPHPHSLKLPFKEGIRDLRSSIRSEARPGVAAEGPFGGPNPARRLARLADDILTQAEAVAGRIRSRDAADLGRRLDSLAEALRNGRLRERSADLYALCRAVLDLDGEPGAVVSEMRLATGPNAPNEEGDPLAAATAAARWMASLGFLRPCLSAALTRGEREDGAALGERVALIVWLAVLVRAESRRDGALVIAGARWAFEAEGETWRGMLRQDRLADLADAWRRTVPYLP